MMCMSWFRCVLQDLATEDVVIGRKSRNTLACNHGKIFRNLQASKQRYKRIFADRKTSFSSGLIKFCPTQINHVIIKHPELAKPWLRTIVTADACTRTLQF